MSQICNSTETAQHAFNFEQERRFSDRAAADRLVGSWAATRMGLSPQEADDYAERAVEAGIGSSDGRGGFCFIAGNIAKIGVQIEEVRRRYAIMGNGDCPAIGLFVPVQFSQRA